MKPWYETHCHLTDEAYDQDLPEVLARSQAQGILDLNLIAYDLPSSEAVLALAESWAEGQLQAPLEPELPKPRLHAVIGIHPHDAVSCTPEALARLDHLLKTKARHIVAYGEIGLDFHYDYSPRPVQREAFWAQIRLAHAHGLPLVIHDREAHEETYQILAKAHAEGLLLAEDPGVIHCYSGSPEMADRFLALGFLLGFDGPITFKNAKQPCEAVAHCPLDRLLLETDCPYLSPVPYRGTRNEPAYLPLIAEQMASLKGVSMETLAQKTTENARRLFLRHL